MTEFNIDNTCIGPNCRHKITINEIDRYMTGEEIIDLFTLMKLTVPDHFLKKGEKFLSGEELSPIPPEQNLQVNNRCMQLKGGACAHQILYKGVKNLGSGYKIKGLYKELGLTVPSHFTYSLEVRDEDDHWWFKTLTTRTRCDNCGKSLPDGVKKSSCQRYKCIACPDFDLCQSCFENYLDYAHPGHAFFSWTVSEKDMSKHAGIIHRMGDINNIHPNRKEGLGKITIVSDCLKSGTGCQHVVNAFGHYSHMEGPKIYEQLILHELPIPEHFTHFASLFDDPNVVIEVNSECAESYPCSHSVNVNGKRRGMDGVQIYRLHKLYNKPVPEHFQGYASGYPTFDLMEE